MRSLNYKSIRIFVLGMMAGFSLGAIVYHPQRQIRVGSPAPMEAVVRMGSGIDWNSLTPEEIKEVLEILD